MDTFSCITTANVHDSSAAQSLLRKHMSTSYEPDTILADKGYGGDRLKTYIQHILKSSMKVKIPTKPATIPSNTDQNFKVYQDRWVVERSCAWLNYSRRLWKNCERRIETTEAMTQLAFLELKLNRIWGQPAKW